MRYATILGLLLCAACQTIPRTASTPLLLPVIPAPANVEPLGGSFTVTARTSICASGQKAEWTAGYFASLLARTRGLSLPVVQAPAGHSISFALDAGDWVRSDEGYELRVSRGGIAVSARSPRGLLYGAVTLWQLLTADSTGSGPARLEGMLIRDEPRFAWRGLLLDSARQYQSPEFIEHFIDTMALHKLNTLQWHLTDDQAWRIEIKKYPRLAEVGGWRVPAGAAPQPRTGGIYTQETIRHLVAYAAERGVTIVPEIDMPGHATAAIVAYPQLASIEHPPTAIPADWGVYPNLYNVDDATFTFLEDVLDEVIALFPGTYIHVGGDEAVKDQWKASPRIQARMRELGIESEAKLQSFFTKRIEEFLRSRGRRLIGWDEILEGDLPPKAAVTSWRGIEGAVAAAQSGHDAVLSPAPTFYLDNRQSVRQDHPPGRGHVVPIDQLYAFDPRLPLLAAEEHLLGVQGNLWTEHIRTEERVEFMAWPRGAAVAEMGWSPRERREWRGFANRLVPQARRYQALGIRSAPLELALPDSAADTAFLKAGPRRTSHQLKLCSEKIALSLEDDAPVDGPRAVFLIDVMNPCWIYTGTDLTAGATLTAAVGQVPFNFQIGDDVKKIELLPPLTPDGELEVFAGGCHGSPVATLSLAPAAQRPDVTVLPQVKLEPRGGGTTDLCFRFTQGKLDPMWAIQWIEVRP